MLIWNQHGSTWFLFHCLPAQSCALEVCVKAHGGEQESRYQPESDKEKQTLIYIFCHKLIWIF